MTTWAEDTTQDKLEKVAKERGWRVTESTAYKTVLKRWCGELTIHFETRERNGVLYTVTKEIDLHVPWDSFDKFDLASQLIEKLGSNGED